ncbi:unnamed protein product [Schistosoma mattheei]|uniref:Uncharacterized protein n=1 Tax=Schistosoma mattheei TaxID=31246 RepID=A0A183PWC0_9TREM|nr:unnamed protein product [Schistosoma mattheei]
MISTTGTTTNNNNNNDQVVLPTEEIQNFRKRFESLQNFINTRLKLHQSRLERYKKFMEHNQKFEEWLSNTETKLNYMIEDIVGRIEHLIPESESYSITSNNEYNQNLSIGTQFINKDNNLSIYIEKIDKLWLSIMNNAESQLDTFNSLFLSIEKEVEHPENFQIKIINFKNHIFLNLKQKINDLIKNLKEYQHYNEEFLNQLSRSQTYMNNQEKRIIQFSTRQLCNSMPDSIMMLIGSDGIVNLPDNLDGKLFYIQTLKQISNDLNHSECSNSIQLLHDSREQLISILNRIKQTNLTQCWQLAVDNHLKFQETFQSCSMEFQMIKSEFIEGCPFNDEIELTNTLNNNDNNNHEISPKTKWNRTDQIYNHFLGWLSNLMNKLDRFTVISYQSCIELLQLTSLTTSLKGYNLMNEQLIELKKSAEQLSTDLVELYHRIELTMIEHLKMDQEKYELKNWLNEHEQKLIELNKPLEVVLSFDNIISSSSTSSESLRSSLFSLNAILSSWSMHENGEQQKAYRFTDNWLLKVKEETLVYRDLGFLGRSFQSFASFVKEKTVSSIRRVFQNLSSRSQHLRSFEERQSLVISNYKTYIVDRVNKSVISDDIKQIISNVSNSELNTDYSNLINYNKELISKIEKIINQDTKFNDLAQSLLSEINTLSDNLRILEEDFCDMKSHIVMDNNNKSVVDSQELLWTRDLVQYKINELNQQTRDVSLKNIHEKLNILEEMFNSLISLNNPEENLANELLISMKNQLSKLTERIDQQSALLSLILNQMKDMSEKIVQHKEWFSHLLIKVESIETELPVDLESKKTLLVQYQVRNIFLQKY